MFKLLLLVIASFSGQPVQIVDVGLLYHSQQECEADFPRASGMLNQILENKYGKGVVSVGDHVCKPEERPA